MDGRTNRRTDRRQTDRCFQYTFTLTQNHEEIKNHPEHVSNIRSFFDLYNWAGIALTKQSSLKQIISTMTIITKIMPVQKKLRKSIENLIKLLQLSY